MNIQPIKSAEEYSAALEIISALVETNPQSGTPEADRLEKLEALVKAYECAVAAEMLEPRLDEPQHLKGMFGKAKRAVSIEEMNAAIAEAGARAGC